MVFRVAYLYLSSIVLILGFDALRLFRAVRFFIVVRSSTASLYHFLRVRSPYDSYLCNFVFSDVASMLCSRIIIAQCCIRLRATVVYVWLKLHM